MRPGRPKKYHTLTPVYFTLEQNLREEFEDIVLNKENKNFSEKLRELMQDEIARKKVIADPNPIRINYNIEQTAVNQDNYIQTTLLNFANTRDEVFFKVRDARPDDEQLRKIEFLGNNLILAAQSLKIKSKK